MARPRKVAPTVSKLPTVAGLSADSERAILDYAQRGHQLLINQYSMRSNLEMLDRYYMREDNFTEENIRAKISNKVGDKKHIQDVVMPIIMPQVEAAVGYMANVFLTGYPIFGVSSDPGQEDAALQMETIIAENSITAGWARELMMFFRDGLKYNLHGVELEWQNRTVYNVQSDITAPSGAIPKKILWHGNTLKRMDLYNTFFDPRVRPSEIHRKAEYAGYIEMMSRVQLHQYVRDCIGDVPPAVMERALNSGPSPGGMTGSGSPFSYYIPIINPYPIMAKQNTLTFDWTAWVDNTQSNINRPKYTNVYEVMKLYARIIPADMGIICDDPDTPQIWKFVLINGQVCICAQQQTNAHNFLPIFFGQPLEDGLDFQTKSFAANVMDMQDIASALMNGYIASKRRLVGDRVIYDPSRIAMKDINSTNPAAKIPVRPSAFGKPLTEAVYPFPFRDDQVQSMLDGATRVVNYANQINGQNNATQGQFQKGNRTKTEYEDIMGHGNTHNQMMAMMTEAQVFTPLKEALKLNILQFQGQTQIYNRDKKAAVDINPIELRQNAVHFLISDGMLPKEKEMGTDEYQVLLQTLGAAPNLTAGFNEAPMFTYLMKLRGLDLAPFEKSSLQQQFEQMQESWEQVATQAVKSGMQPPPQPQMPPELVQELQAKQSTGGAGASVTSQALQSTQGPSATNPPPTAGKKP